MKTIQFTPMQKSAIVDALEMRAKEAKGLAEKSKPIAPGLSRAFDEIEKRAEDALAAIEIMEQKGEW